MANVEMQIDSIRVSLINYQSQEKPTSISYSDPRAVWLKEKAGERYLPIWISPVEADAIAVKLERIEFPRPLFPDFTCAVIDALSASIQSAIIDRLENDCFYAKVILQSDRGEQGIDCRPSDALAVAVRRDVRIFADEKVLDKAGIVLQEEGKQSPVQASQH